MIESPWGTGITGLDAAIDLTGLDFVSRALDLSRPTLILHSDDDGYVPSTASRALAEARPDIVTLVPFSVAKHTRLWNYDRERWNEAIRSWLTRL
jgi:pimeloyl-ACP methyl ester carboxylesterase